MDTSEQSQSSAVAELGKKIRQARHKRGWSMIVLAEKIDRPREWLNRAELGYGELGEYRPPSRTDMSLIYSVLENCFSDSLEATLKLADAADAEFQTYKSKKATRRKSLGKLTQTEVIIGEAQVVHAITDLIQEQHSDAIIRNTGIKTPGNYMGLSQEWKKYRHALGEFLNNNPNGLFKRVEYASTKKQLKESRSADEKLAGDRQLKKVHNARIKFYKHNPLQMHAVIGQREAILALPQSSGQAGSNVALFIRDKAFVEALRIWYDEVLWDAPGECEIIDFANFKSSFENVEKLYGFDKE